MGNTLLSEEVNFVGFLPLQTYIDKQKTISNGVKCPQDKEGIIRCFRLKEHIEDLQCTADDMKSKLKEE